MATNSDRSLPMLVELRFQVKTYDIDFAGHVSNIVYIRWLEDLRLKLLEEHLPIEDQLEAGYGPVLTRTEIEYKRALKLGEEPVGRMWLARATRVRWVVQAEIAINGEVVALAMQEGCFVEMSTGRPIPLPEPLRAKANLSTK